MKISAEKAITAFETVFMLTVIAVLGLAWYSFRQTLEAINQSPLMRMILN